MVLRLIRPELLGEVIDPPLKFLESAKSSLPLIPEILPTRFAAVRPVR